MSGNLVTVCHGLLDSTGKLWRCGNILRQTPVNDPTLSDRPSSGVCDLCYAKWEAAEDAAGAA